jgi:hypothetical protein
MVLKFTPDETLKIQLLGTYHGIAHDDKEALATIVIALVVGRLELLREPKSETKP